MGVVDGDVIKAAVEFVLYDGTIAQNVYYFIAKFATEQALTLVLNAVQQYAEDILAAVAAYIDSQVDTNPMEVSKIDWDPGTGKWITAESYGVRTPAFTPTGAGDRLPNQMAAVITANTPRPKSRGRKFLPGFVETAAIGGDLITAALTALTTALNHYIADETVADTDVLSPGVPRAGVNEFLEFTNGEVNSIMGTQRRRKPGVGA